MNEKKLRELYFEKGWSGKRISEEYDISAHYYLKKYGIETRSGSEKIEIPKDDLKELYFNKNLSLKNIGDRFGCCGSTVKRRMEEYGLETRSPTDSYDIDGDKLYNLYYEEQKSLNEVANFFDVSVGVITGRMDKNDWKRRTGGESKNINEEKIYKLYYKEEKTLEQIGNFFDVCPTSILRRMEKNGWERRSQKKHIKNLKYWEGKERPEFSEKYSGDNHWHSGKKISEKWGDKISEGVKKSYEKIDGLREERRKTLIKHLKNKKDKVCPNYNPKACEIIEEYGDNHGYNFQHAENGGEYYIKNIGRWIDGYDEKANVAVEVYERNHHHYKGGNLKNEDKLREKSIIEELDCKFIRISLNRNREVSQIKQIN